jgi:rhodanese-related sulfurtransferase
MSLIELHPTDIAGLIADDKITLVDVREPYEVAMAKIDGALVHPLSSFTPSELPDDATKPIVFFCAGGVRSKTAVELCRAAALPQHQRHMIGGIALWYQSGLPITR